MSRFHQLIACFPPGATFTMKVVVLLPSLLSFTGCAIHYFDKDSGTEHLWGFGHMKMKYLPPHEGIQAVVTGTETIGLSIGAGQQDYHIGAGWDYRRQILVSSNAMLRLEWPDGDFYNVRLGTTPPFEQDSNEHMKEESK